MAQPKTVTRNLPRLFTQEELTKMNNDLLDLIEEEEKLQITRKEESGEYTGKFKEMKEKSRELAHNLRAKQSDVDIKCSVEYNVPKENEKTITRPDTKESWIEIMTEDEKQGDLGFDTTGEETTEETTEETAEEVSKRLAKDKKKKPKAKKGEKSTKAISKGTSKEEKEISLDPSDPASGGQADDEEFNKNDTKPKTYNVFEDTGSIDKFLFEMKVRGDLTIEKDIEKIKDNAENYAKNIKLKLDREKIIIFAQ